jgi:glycerol-3-phosphate cytidylyltransferase
MLHYGHINLLKRAKEIGNYLIVALSTDEFSLKEKHKKTFFNYQTRREYLESIRYVDLIIPEYSWEQKENDIKKHHIDYFVIGNDWKGKFDFLKKLCEVVYLERTPDISTTIIKNNINKN